MHCMHCPKSRVRRPQAQSPSCSQISLLSFSNQPCQMTSPRSSISSTPAAEMSPWISSLAGTFLSTRPTRGKQSKGCGVNHSGQASFKSSAPGLAFPIRGLIPTMSLICAQAAASFLASSTCTFLASMTASTTTGEARARATTAPCPQPTTNFGLFWATFLSSVATEVRRSTRVALANRRPVKLCFPCFSK